jgi:hypothetical protein
MAPVESEATTVAPEAPMAGVLYVAGHGRSGSTLLDVMVSEHPDVVGLGELHRLSLDPIERWCADGHPVSQSPFWAPVIESVCARYGVPVDGWPARLPTSVVRGSGPRRRLLDLELMAATDPVRALVSRLPPLADYLPAIHHSLAFIDEAARRSGASWAVDSTKNPARMKAMWAVRPERVRIVHLLRDGRAVAASNRRRMGVPIEESARRWAAENLKVRWALATVPRRSWLVLRYEDLCADPGRALDQVDRLLGVDSSRRVTAPDRTVERHQIPGNEWLLADAGTGPVRVDLDERWRRHWSAADEAAYRAGAGGTDGRYGYGRT